MEFAEFYLNGGVNAVGVVTASAFVGDGSQLTGISGGGGTMLVLQLHYLDHSLRVLEHQQQLTPSHI